MLAAWRLRLYRRPGEVRRRPRPSNRGGRWCWLPSPGCRRSTSSGRWRCSPAPPRSSPVLTWSGWRRQDGGPCGHRAGWSSPRRRPGQARTQAQAPAPMPTRRPTRIPTPARVPTRTPTLTPCWCAAVPASKRPVITAAGVSAGIDLGLRLVRRLHGDATARAVQLAIEYDPAPELGGGSAATADALTRQAVLAGLAARGADWLPR